MTRKIETSPLATVNTSLFDGTKYALADVDREYIERNYDREQRERENATAKILSPGFEREDTSWMDRSGCLKADPETFFPLTNEAKLQQPWLSYCNLCPVAALCGDYGTRHQFVGVWGGVYYPGPLLSGRPKGRPKGTGYSRKKSLERVS